MRSILLEALKAVAVAVAPFVLEILSKPKPSPEDKTWSTRKSPRAPLGRKRQSDPLTSRHTVSPWCRLASTGR
jgi:hypothetical protein